MYFCVGNRAVCGGVALRRRCAYSHDEDPVPQKCDQASDIRTCSPNLRT